MNTVTRKLKHNIKYLKMERALLRSTIKKQERIVVGCIAISIVAIMATLGYTISLNMRIDQEQAKNAELTNTVSELKAEQVELTDYLAAMTATAIELEEENRDLISDNTQLAKEWDEMDAQLVEWRERTELYDKYEYAIIRNDGTRTDINYDDFRYLEDIAKENGISQDGIDLCLSFVMAESNGIEKAANPSSSARGYGQLLSSTGRTAWTKLMGRTEPYDHNSMALDGRTNLEMTMMTIDYLDEYYHGNATSVVTSYRGAWVQSYVDKLNRYLARGTTPCSVATLKIHDTL